LARQHFVAENFVAYIIPATFCGATIYRCTNVSPSGDCLLFGSFFENCRGEPLLGETLGNLSYINLTKMGWATFGRFFHKLVWSPCSHSLFIGGIFDTLFCHFETEQCLETRVARFFLGQHSKTGKIYQITIDYTNWPQNKSNGR
jgi:hypothetical protein